MRFQDIKPFVQKGHIEFHVPLQHLEKQLAEFFKEPYYLDINPDFQRGHVWTEAQQIAYTEFFFRKGETARTIYFNYPNWETEHPESDIKQMVLVDGLQRLTALRRFMNNEIPLLGYKFSEFTDKMTTVDFTLKFNINTLITRKEVLKWYLDMNSGGTVHSETELQRVRRLYESI